MEVRSRRSSRPNQAHDPHAETPAGEHIELALDSGEIRTLANGRSVPVSEIELELKHGSHRVVSGGPEALPGGPAHHQH
jgi:hypothetical protein